MLQNQAHRGLLLLALAQRPNTWQKGSSEPTQGLLFLTRLETPCFENHVVAEIPTLAGTTPPPQTQMCFAPTADWDLALRHYPAVPFQQGGACGHAGQATAGGGACAGAGGRASFSSAPGPPDQPRAPSWSATLASTSIPEQSAHSLDRHHSSSTMEHQKPCKRAVRIRRHEQERNAETRQQDDLKTKSKPLQNFKPRDESMLEDKKKKKKNHDCHIPPPPPGKSTSGAGDESEAFS